MSRTTPPPTDTLDRGAFASMVRAARREFPGQTLVIPVCARLLEDQLTPVLAYRRLVAPDERTAPSFLLESVEGGERQGRHSILGAQPALEVIARRDGSTNGGANIVRVTDHRPQRDRGHPPLVQEALEADPLGVPRRLTHGLRLVRPPGVVLPDCLIGGWVGYAAYDTVRYAEPEKLSFDQAPPDDRHLPDLHFAYYDGVVVFDHVDKVVHVVRLVEIEPNADDGAVVAAHARALASMQRRLAELQTHAKPLPSGLMPARRPTGQALPSNLTRAEHAAMLDRAVEYIRAGDIFQVVLGQRFERRSMSDPFDVYRALRAVNPSPYMVYLQAEGSILVASSPEILCRVRHGETGRTVTNRPLAGTRRRGQTPEEDAALECELLADPKERAEHVMLVDLGRNDVGKVSAHGTVRLPAVMAVERYSHVMHISSTVTGTLRDGMDAWDTLRATLPVGTISGAPKIRAMQIIDELEPVRRGPYGGGFGYVSLDGDMDIALALRTMVVPTAMRDASGAWIYHLQASGGIVLDSVASAEYEETVNKAAALARAIDVAEEAFGSASPP